MTVKWPQVRLILISFLFMCPLVSKFVISCLNNIGAGRIGQAIGPRSASFTHLVDMKANPVDGFDKAIANFYSLVPNSYRWLYSNQILFNFNETQGSLKWSCLLFNIFPLPFHLLHSFLRHFQIKYSMTQVKVYGCWLQSNFFIINIG